MMEFNVTIGVDTQDPKLGYNMLRQALQFNGLDVTITDNWMQNHRPFDPDEAAKIAAHWTMIHDQMSVDNRIRFKCDGERWKKAYIEAHEELHRILNEGS